MRNYPFDFGVCIARLGQATLFNLTEFAPRTTRVFVDGASETPPAKWQGSRASWGCALSHLAAIRAAMAANVQRAVIFEFDAEPACDQAGTLVPLEEISRTIAAALDRLDARDPRWGALYLGGYFPRGAKQIPLDQPEAVGEREASAPGVYLAPELRALTLPARLIQTDAVMLAHAYALSAVGLQAAAQICERAISGNSLWPYGHIDVAFSTTLLALCSIYAIEPWLFGQAEHVSELTGKLCKRPVDTGCRVKIF